MEETNRINTSDSLKTTFPAYYAFDEHIDRTPVKSCLPPHFLALDHETVLHALKYWAGVHGNTVHSLRWYERGNLKTELSYADLWNRIEVYCIQIEKFVQRQDRVVLLFEPCIDFVLQFFACLRIGVIAVPCYPPMPNKPSQGITVLHRVMETCGASVVLLSPNVDRMRQISSNRWPKKLSDGTAVRYQRLAQLSSNDPAIPIVRSPMPSEKEIAFLQFSSGSTGEPKGVIVGHDNYKWNMLSTIPTCHFETFSETEMKSLATTSWLPLYHDMGLSQVMSTALYVGATCNLMSPFDFLRDPLVWFDVISETRTTHATAPNFAFSLINRKWDSKRARMWDLSSVRFGNAAEPVVPQTIEEFIAHLRADVPSYPGYTQFGTGYGLAEHVAVVGGTAPVEINDRVEGNIASISSMDRLALGGVRLRIVSPQTLRECTEGEEGEIWVQSPSVARGYWGAPELTVETFQNTLEGEAGMWLRTGDLGIVTRNKLFVSGRIKDVIIINGKNYWPQDIEQAVQEAHSGVRPGCVAAFPVTLSHISSTHTDGNPGQGGGDGGGTEGFVVVAELRQNFAAEKSVHLIRTRVLSSIAAAVRVVTGRDALEIVLIRERSIPKTTSGKIRRKETKKRWMEHSLQVLQRSGSTGGVGLGHAPGDAFSTKAGDGEGASVDFAVALSWITVVVNSIVSGSTEATTTISTAAGANPPGATAELLSSSELDNEEEKRIALLRAGSANAVGHGSMELRCREVCTRFGVRLQHARLVEQGLDSLKASELAQILADTLSSPSFLPPSGAFPQHLHTFVPPHSSPSIVTPDSAPMSASLPKAGSGNGDNANNIGVDFVALYDWTGEDLVYAICGVLPERERIRLSGVIFSSPLSDESLKTVNFEPSMDTFALDRSFSLPQRVFCEAVGLSLLLSTVLLAILPAVLFYQAASKLPSPSGVWDIDTSSDPNWVSVGMVTVLSFPIALLSLTALWLAQKWLFWGRYRAEFVPMHAWRYYLWWYVDRVTAVWEFLVFPFIAETPLANAVYLLAGASDITLTSTLALPIRCPGLVTVGAHTIIDGYVLPQQVLPHGVSMAPIRIGAHCSVRTRSVVQRGCVLGDIVHLEPLAVVPAFSVCEGGYVWEGNLCQRGLAVHSASSSASSNDNATTATTTAATDKLQLAVDASAELETGHREEEQLVAKDPKHVAADDEGGFVWATERLARVCAVASAIWITAVFVALSGRLWQAVFSSYSTASFWFYAWQYYFTGLSWCLWALAVKWGYFGAAKEGPYSPGFMERIMRWALSFWSQLAYRLFITQYGFTMLNLWQRLMGIKMAASAHAVDNDLACHPADCDLIELHDHARTSVISYSPLDSGAQWRRKIVLGECAEVGLHSVVSGGVTLGKGAYVGSKVYLPVGVQLACGKRVYRSLLSSHTGGRGITIADNYSSTEMVDGNNAASATRAAADTAEAAAVSAGVRTIDDAMIGAHKTNRTNGIQLRKPTQSGNVLCSWMAFGLCEALVSLVPYLFAWAIYHIYIAAGTCGGAGLDGILCVVISAVLVSWVLLLTLVLVGYSTHRLWHAVHFRFCSPAQLLVSTVSAGDRTSGKTLNKAISLTYLSAILWMYLGQIRHAILSFFGPIWAGTVLLNVALNLAGARVNLSAKILNDQIWDPSLLSIGNCAVISERGNCTAHTFEDGELRFGRTVCMPFSCMDSWSALFAEQCLESCSQIGAHTVLAGSSQRGTYLHGTSISRTDSSCLKQ